MMLLSLILWEHRSLTSRGTGRHLAPSLKTAVAKIQESLLFLWVKPINRHRWPVFSLSPSVLVQRNSCEFWSLSPIAIALNKVFLLTKEKIIDRRKEERRENKRITWGLLSILIHVKP